LVDGKALSKKSEHSHDTVAHRTIDQDGPGRMRVYADAQISHRQPATSYRNLYEMVSHQHLAQKDRSQEFEHFVTTDGEREGEWSQAAFDA